MTALETVLIVCALAGLVLRLALFLRPSREPREAA